MNFVRTSVSIKDGKEKRGRLCSSDKKHTIGICGKLVVDSISQNPAIRTDTARLEREMR